MLGDFKDNKKEPIGTSHKIYVYFNRIGDSVKFAANRKTPYTPKQTLQTVYHTVLAKGLYTDETKEWRRKMAADKI